MPLKMSIDSWTCWALWLLINQYLYALDGASEFNLMIAIYSMVPYLLCGA
jgi:hypothetical protein